MIPVVLYGQTGCGKTRLLRELSGRGFPIIDLEFLANHRGSAFGQLNIPTQQRSQKDFETRIETALEEASYSKFIFLEFESSNLGKLRVPDFICDMFKDGVKVLLRTDVAQRVKYILGEYLPADKDSLVNCLYKLKDRIDTLDNNYATGNISNFDQLKSLLESGQYEQFCYRILEYYDTSKNYTLNQSFDYTLYDQGSRINADRLLSWMYERYLASDLTTGSTLS